MRSSSEAVGAPQLDAAAEAPDGLPWGRMVERDDGIHPFAKGILDQAMAPFETYAELTGKRGALAQIGVMQGLFFTLGSLTGRNAAAAENRKQMLLQMAQVDLFKTEPLRAAGRLTFDLGTLFIPAGAAAKAGSFGRVAGSMEAPSPRLEVTVPPAPGIRAITEARPGLLDQLGEWVERHVLTPAPAGGVVPGRHQFDVAHNEVPEGSPGAGSGDAPQGPPKYGVQIPEQSNPNGPGRDPAMQPVLGQSDHGPGHWRNEHSSPLGREYQQHVTGVQPVGDKVPEYVLDYDKTHPKTGIISRAEVKIDGFYWEKGPPPVQVYGEGKGAYAWMETKFKDSTFYEATLERMANRQLSNQIDAVKQAGGNARLEWHFLEQKVADDFFDLIAEDERFSTLLEKGRIVIKWTPMS